MNEYKGKPLSEEQVAHMIQQANERRAEMSPAPAKMSKHSGTNRFTSSANLFAEFYRERNEGEQEEEMKVKFQPTLTRTRVIVNKLKAKLIEANERVPWAEQTVKSCSKPEERAIKELCTILTAEDCHFDVKKLPKVTEILKLAIIESGLQTKCTNIQPLVSETLRAIMTRQVEITLDDLGLDEDKRPFK